MPGNIFYTGLSGLGVARGALLTTAHNTANVSTAGYSRQIAQISAKDALASSSGFTGSGAGITTVTRSYDRYLTTQLAEAESSGQALDTYAAQASRIDAMLADPTTSLAPLMQSFFAGVQGVVNNPADPAARQQMIGAANVLASKFRSTDQYLTDLNTSINAQVESTTAQINTYASQIASLNHQINQLSSFTSGQPPNDLLDQRDLLINSLGKMVGIKVLEQENGQYDVSFGNGQALVRGDRASVLRAVNSSADPSRKVVAATGSNGQLTELDDATLTGGTLGGLVAFRAEMLTPTQNAIGRMAMVLADTFNAQHRLGVDLQGAPGENFFSQATPAVLANTDNTGDLSLQAGIADASRLTTSDYAVDVSDVGGTLTYAVTRLSDRELVGSYTSFPASFDGVTLSVGGGSAKAGDSFLLQPTRAGARDLRVQISTPSRVAAASPVVTGSTSGNRGTGTIGTATLDDAYLSAPLTGNLTLRYDATANTLSGFPASGDVTVTLADGAVNNYPAGSPVPYSDGASMRFNGISISIKGAPSSGDTFTLKRNVVGVSDGSNALLLGALQRQNTMADGTTTFNGAYGLLVNEAGNKAMQVQVTQAAQSSMTDQIRATQQSISGVNQDEETANLLMFQQMYQANAKVIQTASLIFDAILGIRS